MLEMPHDQNLAVILAKLFECGVKPIDQLVADRFGRRRRSLVAQGTCQIH